MKSVYRDNIIFQEQHIKQMKSRQLNASVTKARQTQPKSELSNQSEWEERKILIIKINPHTEFLFQKIDFDYSELFLELGVFLSDGLSLAMKKIFLEKNYDKILIHFFQHLFDFELQTLKFKQKHETILSFAEWIEDEVSFEYPDKIQLLHKRKKYANKIPIFKPQHSQKQNQATDNQIETQLFLKRSLDKRFQQQCSIKQIESISSPKKKKVFQDQQFELQFVDFTSKYEDSTNHSTINTTPKDNVQKTQEKNMVFKQNTSRSYPNKTFGAVRGSQNHKQKIGREIKSGQYQPKTNKKQAYRLKPGYKQKRADTKIDESKITSKPHNKKIDKNADPAEQNFKVQLEEDLIELENDNSQAFQKPITLNQQKCQEFLDDLQISGLDLYERDYQFKSEVSNLSKVGSIGSQDEQFIFQQVPQKSNKQILRSLRLLQIQPKLNQANYEDLSLQNQNDNLIVQQVQSNSKIDSMKLKRRYLAEQMSKKQAYSMRARLSGIFKYSQKRYYIFPDMTITLDENKQDQNEKPLKSRTKSGEHARRK